jgi:transcription antitermination protein NusB
MSAQRTSTSSSQKSSASKAKTNKTGQQISSGPVKGTRRLVREKVMQIFSASDISAITPADLFHYIFPYDFRGVDPKQPDRYLTDDEIAALDADPIIDWQIEEKEFALELIKEVERHGAYCDELITKYSQNWDINRIAQIDRIVLRIAIVELIAFPEIPPKVTVNEALEIVKRFSTERSNLFVNGILDAVLLELKSTGKIVKTGRGLIDESLNT